MRRPRQRARRLDGGWAPDLQEQIGSVPAGAVPPDLLREVEGDGHLVRRRLLPGHLLHQRVRPAVPHPVDVARGAVEPDRQRRLRLGHEVRHPRAERDAERGGLGRGAEHHRPDDRLERRRARREGVRVGGVDPGERRFRQVEAEVAVEAAGHVGARAGGEEPVVRGSRRRASHRQPVGLAGAGGVVVQFHHHRQAVEERHPERPPGPHRVGALDRLHHREQRVGALGAPPPAAGAAGRRLRAEQRPRVGAEGAATEDADVTVGAHRPRQARRVAVERAHSPRHVVVAHRIGERHHGAVRQHQAHLGAFGGPHGEREVLVGRPPDPPLRPEGKGVDPERGGLRRRPRRSAHAVGHRIPGAAGSYGYEGERHHAVGREAEPGQEGAVGPHLDRVAVDGEPRVAGAGAPEQERPLAGGNDVSLGGIHHLEVERPRHRLDGREPAPVRIHRDGGGFRFGLRAGLLRGERRSGNQGQDEQWKVTQAHRRKVLQEHDLRQAPSARSGSGPSD